MLENRQIKEKVLNCIANGKNCRKAASYGREKWLIGDKVVHVRYRSRPVSGAIYSYNINPNTLKSDYELWICGGTETYYLIPTSVMKMIYNHPDAYTDYTHPEIRVADVNIVTHKCRYARNGQTLDFSAYHRAIA